MTTRLLARGDATSKSAMSLVRRVLGPDAVLGYLLLVPIALLVMALLIYPIVMAIGLTFYDKPIGLAPRFIGLGNYVELFRSARFLQVIQNSVVYTVSAVILKLIFGMGMALVLNESFPGRQVFRGYLLLPFVIPTVVSALVWRWMFDLNNGIINGVLIEWNMLESGIPFLADKMLAKLAVVVVNTWRGVPFFGVSLLAGMQAIPKELYEAAEIDGAGPWARFRNVTLPGLRTVMLILTILSTIWTFNDFEIVYIMTQGGPSYATHLFATFTYEMAFRTGRLGFAMAASTVVIPLMVLMILALSPLMLQEEE